MTVPCKFAPKLRFKADSGNTYPDWIEKSITSFAVVRMGQSPPSSSYNSEAHGVPLIQGNTDLNSIGRYTSSPTKMCSSGEVLLTVRAPVGCVAIAPGDACIGRGVCVISSKDCALNMFIYYLLLQFTPRWKRLEQGSTFTAIDGGTIGNVRLLIPSDVGEQKKIADFLSAVDTKIDLLEKKKELFEKYKKGLMQQIFSQKIRFKDDNGNDYPEWKTVSLGEVFSHVRGRGLSRGSVVAGGTNACVLYGELYTTYPEQILKTASYTNEAAGVLSQNNDLLIPTSTTTTGIDLANVTFLSETGVLIGGDITILRSKEVDGLFYAYYLTHHKKFEIAKYAQGSTIVHLYFSHIKKIPLDVPNIEEQQKIANFLSTVDIRIDILSRQIRLYGDWKKGLLQQMFVL